MNLETFFEKFDLFADCPNAVQKMRELILELAVQGKLVEQQGESWKSVVLGEIVDLISGQHLLGHEHNSEGKGIPYLTGPSDFGDRTPIPTRWTESPKVVAESGDILITVKGAGVGKTNILLDGPTAISRQLMAVRVTRADSDFVHLVLKGAANHFQATMVGIAIPGIGRKDVLSLKLVLPPLAEQKRIVAKVDELMALCDALEAQQKERETKRAQLAKASLSAFADAPSPTSLELLFHPSFSIDSADLRKSILTLAVQGKLVPQDAGDDDVSSLLVNIDNARLQLQSEGSVPKQKGTLECDEEDQSHPVPKEWAWVRLQRIAEVIDPNPSHRMPIYSASGIPFISTENFVGDDTIDFSIGKKVTKDELEAQKERFSIRPGSFALTRIGTIGKTCSLPEQRTYCMSHAIVLISPYSDAIHSRFIRLVVSSDAVQNQAEDGAKSIGVPDLGMGKIRQFSVPLPPLAEQKRIVAKVDELMALVDRLEAKIVASREAASRLLEAMVAELSGKAA